MSTEVDDQQRVISEASHDLANCIHRSYYFIELLADVLAAGDETASLLLTRLRGTVEEIESLARTTLEFVRPVELKKLRVRMDDLVASLRQHVGLRGIDVGGDASVGRAEVEIDPARISDALSCLCKIALSDLDGEAPISVELIGGDPVGLRIRRSPGPPRVVRADLMLALTAKIARAHGGALDVEDGEMASVTLRLPVAGRGA